MNDRPTLVFHFLSSRRETSTEDDKDDGNGGGWRCSGTNAVSSVCNLIAMVRLWIVFHFVSIYSHSFCGQWKVLSRKNMNSSYFMCRNGNAQRFRQSNRIGQAAAVATAATSQMKNRKMYVWQLSLPTMTDHHHRRHFATLLIPQFKCISHSWEYYCIHRFVSHQRRVATTIGFTSLGGNKKLVAQSSKRFTYSFTRPRKVDGCAFNSLIQ